MSTGIDSKTDTFFASEYNRMKEEDKEFYNDILEDAPQESIQESPKTMINSQALPNDAFKYTNGVPSYRTPDVVPTPNLCMLPNTEAIKVIAKQLIPEMLACIKSDPSILNNIPGYPQQTPLLNASGYNVKAEIMNSLISNQYGNKNAANINHSRFQQPLNYAGLDSVADSPHTEEIQNKSMSNNNENINKISGNSKFEINRLSTNEYNCENISSNLSSQVSIASQGNYGINNSRNSENNNNNNKYKEQLLSPVKKNNENSDRKIKYNETENIIDTNQIIVTTSDDEIGEEGVAISMPLSTLEKIIEEKVMSQFQTIHKSFSYQSSLESRLCNLENSLMQISRSISSVLSNSEGMNDHMNYKDEGLSISFQTPGIYRSQPIYKNSPLKFTTTSSAHSPLQRGILNTQHPEVEIEEDYLTTKINLLQEKLKSTSAKIRNSY